MKVTHKLLALSGCHFVGCVKYFFGEKLYVTHKTISRLMYDEEKLLNGVCVCVYVFVKIMASLFSKLKS